MIQFQSKKWKCSNLWKGWENLGEHAGGVGGLGVYLSPQIHQEYTFKHRSAYKTPGESGQEYLTSGKEYIEPRKTRQDKGTSGENRSISRTTSALSHWGTEAGV